MPIRNVLFQLFDQTVATSEVEVTTTHDQVLADFIGEVPRENDICSTADRTGVIVNGSDKTLEHETLEGDHGLEQSGFVGPRCSLVTKPSPVYFFDVAPKALKFSQKQFSRVLTALLPHDFSLSPHAAGNLRFDKADRSEERRVGKARR